jgi:ubiquinone/menaquinone biosynthesis C-methylase UbiE
MPQPTTSAKERTPASTGKERRGRNGVTISLLGGAAAGGIGELGEVLDYGCGNAALALALAEEFGLTVHAGDVDSGLIARLRTEHGETVDFFALGEDDPRLPLADASISAATCCDVLEHMPAPLRLAALREIRRVLRPDGVLVVTTPHKGLLAVADPENFKFRFPRLHRAAYSLVNGRERYERTYGGEHFGNFSAGHEFHVHFSAAELAELLARAGFAVDQVRYYRLFYPLVRAALWFSEALVGRLPGASRLRSACWRLYRWDAGLEPGRLANDIAIRARPV